MKTARRLRMPLPLVALALALPVLLNGCVVVTFDGDSLRRVPAHKTIDALRSSKVLPRPGTGDPTDRSLDTH